MARALAIETSGRIGSLALADGERLLEEVQFPHGLKHAAEIIPLIDKLCRKQDWAAKDLEEVYISAGPGSFTGLRIGITLAKTLAFATGLRLVAVPSVRVLIENAPPEAKQVIVVLDAKREQIFTARYEQTGTQWREAEGAHLDSLAAMLQRSPRPVHLLGEGIPHHRQFIPREDGIFVTPEETWAARAAVVARLGGEMATRGEFTDPMRLTPIYIRLPEAEEKWQKAQVESK